MKFSRLILSLFFGAGFGLSVNPAFAQLKVDESEPSESALIASEPVSGEAVELAPTEMNAIFSIPEPSTYGLAGAVLLGALLVTRRISTRSAALVG